MQAARAFFGMLAQEWSVDTPKVAIENAYFQTAAYKAE
jgi:hypothetical protein